LHRLALLRYSPMPKNAALNLYKGDSHGLCTTEKEKVNQDLLAFIKG